LRDGIKQKFREGIRGKSSTLSPALIAAEAVTEDRVRSLSRRVIGTRLPVTGRVTIAVIAQSVERAWVSER